MSFTPAAASQGITLKYYDTPAAIPTILLLPCAGVGEITYDPEPTSPTTKPDVVTVTFISIAV